jgi:hypothetical protein
LPLDYVETLDESDMLAWAVAFGENEGGEFDWSALKWRERD